MICAEVIDSFYRPAEGGAPAKTFLAGERYPVENGPYDQLESTCSCGGMSFVAYYDIRVGDHMYSARASYLHVADCEEPPVVGARIEDRMAAVNSNPIDGEFVPENRLPDAVQAERFNRLATFDLRRKK